MLLKVLLSLFSASIHATIPRQDSNLWSQRVKTWIRQLLFSDILHGVLSRIHLRKLKKSTEVGFWGPKKSNFLKTSNFKFFLSPENVFFVIVRSSWRIWLFQKNHVCSFFDGIGRFGRRIKVSQIVGQRMDSLQPEIVGHSRSVTVRVTCLDDFSPKPKWVIFYFGRLF
jgi:hypothetical protein